MIKQKTPIQRRDLESNPGSVVHIVKEEPLRYLLPQKAYAIPTWAQDP